MFDFTPGFEKIERLRSQLEKAQTTAQKKEAALKAEVAKLLAPLKPICMKAVEEYNNGGGRMRPESVEIGINRKEKTLSLFVRLSFMGGGEPDDEFDDRDLENYNARFGAILNRHLVENAVPLTFGTLSFPTSYYMK
jgi:hypothetical protein